MRHFVKHSAGSKGNPSLLILDNHESHLNPKALHSGKENGVKIITLPPHESHRLQHLDVSCYGPFKTYYAGALQHPAEDAEPYISLDSLCEVNISASEPTSHIDKLISYKPSYHDAEKSPTRFTTSKVDIRSSVFPKWSPVDVRQLPKAEEMKRKVGRKKGKRIIATDTPVKNKLEGKVDKFVKKMKTTKVTHPTRKKLIQNLKIATQ
ncbi:hypothetical protein PR048_001998 [Dryococelus australis]|uniref:DDE-1 domain-containing protein n=1 Tax=Dryococelus australis TaxID=614101 RepID=A0ABQ9IJ28_9NEOP|nr:hypothetical protein PR048_001998 [Dryococelus australis]